MSKNDSTPTQEYLKSKYRYVEETGEFFALHAHAGRPAGRKVAHEHRLGYMQMNIMGRLYYLHRVAWLYIHGEWPEGELDHINGDRADNRIANLREVSRQANMQNMRKANRPKATSQFLGVSYQRRCKTKPWRAVVSKNGKNYCCGHWPTEEEAHAAYVAKKRELHEGCTL